MTTNSKNASMREQSKIDIGALEQRVYGVETGLRDISQQIGALGSKIDERARTPWATLASFAGVMVIVLGAFGTVIYRPIDLEQTRLRADLNEFARSSVARSELALVTKYMDRDFAALQAQVKSNYDAIVPRGEHVEKWAGQNLATANMQRQLDDFRRDFGSTYSLRDGFMNVQRKVDELEKELREKGSGR